MLGLKGAYGSYIPLRRGETTIEEETCVAAEIGAYPGPYFAHPRILPRTSMDIVLPGMDNAAKVEFGMW